MNPKTAEAMEALFARAALMETQGPTLPVCFPEQVEDFVMPASGGYLEVTMFGNQGRWEGLHAGKMDQGLLQITVVWPKRQGVIAPGAAVDAVKAHFAKNTVLRSGTTKVTISMEPYDGPIMPDADTLSIPVTIPWIAVASA